jgi:hypothetical protein
VLSDEDGLALSYQPQVVIDGKGNATAIWSEETEDASVVRTRTRPKGGNWGEPVDLTDSAVGWEPQLAVDPDGTVTAIWNWRSVPEYAGGIIQTKSRPPGGAWSSEPVDLSDADDFALEPQVAVDCDGDAVAVWYGYSDSDQPIVQAARRTTTSGWGTAVDLASDDGHPLNANVAIDSQGTATAVWESYDASGNIVHASTSAAGASWSDPVDISVRDEGPWPGSFPQVAVDPQGDVTAIWKAWYASRGTIVQAARREPGSEWSPLVDVGRSNGVIEPAPVAVDAQGYATAVWTRGSSLYSAVFDPIAPDLGALTVPPSGVAGQPVAMSADPFDLWSPVATRWAFGDGGAGSGPAIDHCFSSPGEYTVSITGADAAANATSASRTITVGPDPTLTPGADPCADSDPGPGDPGPSPGDPGPGPGDPGPGPGDPGPGPGDPRPGPDPAPGPVTAPVLSGLRQSNARWGTPAADRRPRLPLGTTFRFRLDRIAPVRFEFSQIAPGRRAGTRCVKPTKASRAKPQCSRFLTRGTLTVAGRAGSNALAFRGKLRGRPLAPGHYRLRVTARADGRTSSAATLSFTIARS